MRPIPLITAILIAMAPLAHAQDTHEHEHEHEGHVAELGAARLLHAWTRATHDDHALVFVEIENNGDTALTISGGSSPIAQSVELVGFQPKDGAEAYVALGPVAVPAHATMTLAPEQLALRLNGLSTALEEGETYLLEILLGDTPVALTLTVEPAGAHQHHHAGHQH